jgi:hypothetical protein
MPFMPDDHVSRGVLSGTITKPNELEDREENPEEDRQRDS